MHSGSTLVGFKWEWSDRNIHIFRYKRFMFILYCVKKFIFSSVFNYLLITSNKTTHLLNTKGIEIWGISKGNFSFSTLKKLIAVSQVPTSGWGCLIFWELLPSDPTFSTTAPSETRLRRAIMNLSTRPLFLWRLLVVTLAQLVSSRRSRWMRKSVLISLSRWWWCDSPMSKSSAARSSSMTKHSTFRTARGPADRLRTVRGATQTRKQVHLSCFVPCLSTTSSVTEAIFLNYQILFRTAYSAKQSETIDSLTPSSAFQFAK